MPVEKIASVTGAKYTNGDGFYFRLSQRLNNKLYFNCQVKSCEVRANLPSNYSDQDEIYVRGDHNHPPDFFEAEFCEAERRILERAARDPSSLKKIFVEETACVSPKTVSRLNFPSFLRRMQRRRHQDVHMVHISLKEYNKRMRRSEYRNLAYVDGKKFFISAVKNHSILFISPTTRELLRHPDQTYIIYQTRKLVSQNMNNVLIISQIHLNVAFPIVYLAMQHRTFEAYIDVFLELKKEEPLWNPVILFMSREESFVNAVQKVFTKCEIIPSWFHLVQELRRKLEALKLTNLLHSNSDFHNCVEMIHGIFLLPPEFMKAGYEFVYSIASASTLIAEQGVRQFFNVMENWLTEPHSSYMSLFEKSNQLKTELKLMHRQFMSSFRASTRKEIIWSFTKGLVSFEKKYADAYKEILVSNSPPKWTGNSSCRSYERKIHTLMELFSEAKLTVELFLKQFVSVGISVMDLSAEEIVGSHDENVSTNQNYVKDEDGTTSDDCADFEDFIIEEVEYSESTNDIQSIDQKDTYDNPNVDKKQNHEIDEEICEKVTPDLDSIAHTTLVFPSTNAKKLSMVNTPLPHACVECKIVTYSFACQPCGHLCLCRHCAKNAIQRNCPMCDKKVLWAQEIIPAVPLDSDCKIEIITGDTL